MSKIKKVLCLCQPRHSWLQKPDLCDPVSLSTSETQPMGCRGPLCIMGPKCTEWCRAPAETASRRWGRKCGRSVTFMMRWNTSGRWVETNTTVTQKSRICELRQINVGFCADDICCFGFCAQVRDSLEKVRERMYGQFGGMQQSIEKLSQELRVMSEHVTGFPEACHQTRAWINANMYEIAGFQFPTKESGVRG